MNRSHGIIAAAVVAAVAASGIAAAVAVGGGSNDEADADGPRIVQPGAPGEEGRELSEDDATSVDPPAHTPADTRFMQGMIAHHQQAIDMAALVPDLGPSHEPRATKRTAGRTHSTQFVQDHAEWTTSPAATTVRASSPPIQ